MSEFKTRLHSVPSGGFLTDRDKDKKPILDVRELGIDFGGLSGAQRSPRGHRCPRWRGWSPGQ